MSFISLNYQAAKKSFYISNIKFNLKKNKYATVCNMSKKIYIKLATYNREQNNGDKLNFSCVGVHVPQHYDASWDLAYEQQHSSFGI